MNKIAKVKTWMRVNLTPKKHVCLLCGHNVGMFGKIGENSPLFSSRHVIGAGVRRGACPMCGSTDRTRFLYYVLLNHTDIFSRECSVLHFAPENVIGKMIKLNPHCRYVTADIVPGRADVTEDITKISFPDKSFDFIICNHVLEHIPDEGLAVEEMKRCLKDDGKLILSVPICLEQDTFEDSRIRTEEERFRLYGQKDHVRLYGRDFAERISGYGFCVRAVVSNDFFPKEDMKKYGIIDGDMIFLCGKEQGHVPS